MRPYLAKMCGSYGLILAGNRTPGLTVAATWLLRCAFMSVRSRSRSRRRWPRPRPRPRPNSQTMKTEGPLDSGRAYRFGSEEQSGCESASPSAPDKRAHQIGSVASNETHSHGDHHGESDAHPSPHLFQTSDGVELETKALVDPGVDPFDRCSPGVQASPLPNVSRDRREDTTIEIEWYADDTTEVRSSPDRSGFTLTAPRTCPSVGCCQVAAIINQRTTLNCSPTPPAASSSTALCSSSAQSNPTIL